MCIITIFKSEDSAIILTHNRDESVLRPFSDDFCEEKKYNKKIFFPKDLQSGGSWIAYTESHVACILNGGKNKHQRKESYPKSRGNLVIDIHQYEQVEDFLNETYFNDYECFTLYFVDKKNQKVHEIIWNELQVEYQIIQNHILINASSTLYTEEYKTILKNDIETEPLLDEKMILSWHNKHTMELHKVVKHVKTVAICQIKITPSQIQHTFLKK